jgi:hypothetical protein
MNNTPATNTGSTIVNSLEEAWAAIARRHPELPTNIVAITGSGAKGAGWLVRGHWSAGRWEVEGSQLPEVFISGERISEGARPVMATLLHEAAHGLAHARGIKDTSRQGRWHNKRFVAVAQEMGLTTATEADPAIGFSNTEWNDTLEAEYATELAALEAALTASIPDRLGEAIRVATAIIWMMTVWGHSLTCGPPATLVALTRPTRKPRRRKVTLSCSCPNGGVDVFADLVSEFSLHCNVCDEDLNEEGAA